MLLNGWHPFFDMSKTLDEMDRFFGSVNRPLEFRSVPRGTFPAINVYDQDKQVVMVAEIPGVTPEDLELEVLNDTVTLKGKRPRTTDDNDKVYRRERVQGEFSRTITLPDPVNPDTVDARYEDGLVKVTLEKSQEAQAKRIAIHA